MAKRIAFRFRLRSLLAMPIAFAVVFWWVTWPSRTFRSFDDAIARQQFEIVNSAVERRQCFFEFREDGIQYIAENGSFYYPIGISNQFPKHLDLSDRSLADLIQSRMRYRVRGFNPPNPPIEITVQFGKIYIQGR